MASINLTWLRTRTRIDSIQVDATLSELHTAENEVTEHPVEKGANIADHVRRKVDVLQLEGIVSNTPIPQPNDPTSRKVSGLVSFDSRGEMDPKRASTAYIDLLALADSGALINVTTALRRYEDMVIKKLDVPRDAKTGQSLRFTATLVQVKVAQSKVALIDDKGKPKTDVGKKATTEAPEAETNRSVLKQLSNKVGGTELLKKFAR